MIRPNTLVANFSYVSRFDEAVDTAAADFEHKWKVYRDGMGEPPLLSDGKPTLIELRHITTVERTYLLELAQGNDHGLYLAAAGMALVGLKGMADEAGKQLEVKLESTQVGPYRLRHATRASLELLPVEVILEIGALVMERATVRPS